jgi:hypothetical protein
MKVSFILIAEGSSDLRLVEHIERILIEEGFEEARGEAPDLGRFQQPIGTTVKEKLQAVVKYFPSAEIVFIHRDADNAGVEARRGEIMAAALGVISMDKIVPIIPVKMLETWLLADRELISRVAGGRDPQTELSSLPPIRQLESKSQTKSILQDALCEASGLKRDSQLSAFRKRFSEMRARLVLDLDPDGPVRQLSSYKTFRESIRQVVQKAHATS